ncbi:MAG: M48 family metallopeptidase [Gammaproteobacteria bacterium]|nr:M48 family metallopeptidase [Gammaproteobacteria bacterium]NNC76767.1 M48 family metallopeptidase [Woeseiaceae bacterium]
MSLRNRIFAACIAAMLVLAACSTSPTGRNQMILRSDDELAAEAARQFAEMRASIPLETDRATIDYVHCVATAIVEVLDPQYRSLEWDLAVFDHEAVNAFAMPGGKIGVMTGILAAADNQHRLAAVLGHEVAHVTARHSNERASRSPISNVGVRVAAVLLGGGHSGATYTAYEALNAGAALGIMLPFSRSQESEADVIGLEFMARAGFDPRESVPLWQNMASANEKKSEPAEFLSTHPSNEKRIDSLVSQFGKTLAIYNEAQAEGRTPDCEP